MKLLDDALKVLGEHFDSVQIFCSRHESTLEDGTVLACKGIGNWYARYGQVQEWIVKQDEVTRVEIRKNDNL